VSQENPYAPSATLHAPSSSNSEMRLASQGQRFLTCIVDNLVLYAINFIVGLVIGIVLIAGSGGKPDPTTLGLANLISTLFGLLVVVAYYIAMEATTGMTLGKMVMGTKVVNQSGNTPTLGQVVGRSFCRLIPFEFVSFFGNKGFPIGWHDSIPGTRVVKTR